jgi:hypothetical protein
MDDLDSRPIGPKEIDCAFKCEDWAHLLERAGETREDGTIVDTASDDTCVEEGFCKGCFGEGWWLFVLLNVFFVDIVEIPGLPIDMVNDAVDVVEKNVGVAVDAFELIDIRVIIPIRELKYECNSRIRRLLELLQRREQLCKRSRSGTKSRSSVDPALEDKSVLEISFFELIS